jgi:hypothetical protein
MEPVWLLLGSGCNAAGIHLGFLASWLFRCEGSPIRGLDFLGFPWILSSESRLINGLRGKKRERIFLGAFRAVSSAGMVVGLRFVACGTAGLFMGRT